MSNVHRILCQASCQVSINIHSKCVFVTPIATDRHLMQSTAAARTTGAMMCLFGLQGPSDTLGLGGEGGSGASDAAGASYLDAFAAFRDEVRAMKWASNLLAGHGWVFSRIRPSSNDVCQYASNGCAIFPGSPLCAVEVHRATAVECITVLAILTPSKWGEHCQHSSISCSCGPVKFTAGDG